MLKQAAKVGMKVVFDGAQGKIVKINPTRAKVESTQSYKGRKAGTVWTVPYSIMEPLDPKEKAKADAYEHIKVSDIQLTLRSEDTLPCSGRVDHYYDGTLIINGRKLDFELHLWKDDHFNTDQPGTWLPCIDLNKNGHKFDDCRECCGNRGRSGPHTSGDTAVVLGREIFPLLKDYKITQQEERFHPGQWFIFRMRLDDSTEIDVRASRYAFHNDHHKQIVCPVHGAKKQVEVESVF